MVVNFLRGGTAVNVVARELGARVVVAGLGVAADLPANPAMRIRRGTQNIVHGPAMTLDQAVAALRAGRVLVRSGRGTGIDDAGLARKQAAVRRAPCAGGQPGGGGGAAASAGRARRVRDRGPGRRDPGVGPRCGVRW